MPQAAIEGWYTIDESPHLLGLRCDTCSTVSFPPINPRCPNPGCRGDTASTVPLSRVGTTWSCTSATYEPPAPYVRPTAEFEPFAIAAVELAREQLVVLGQVATGYTADEIKVGTPMELIVETLYEIDGDPHLVYKWRPLA